MSDSLFSPTQPLFPPECPPPPPPPLPPTLTPKPSPTAVYKCSPILKILLEGIYDEGSNLARLRGCQHVIKIIWTKIQEYYKPKVISVGLGKGKNLEKRSSFLIYRYCIKIPVYVKRNCTFLCTLLIISFLFKYIYGPGGNGTATATSSIYLNLKVNLNLSFLHPRQSAST